MIKKFYLGLTASLILATVIPTVCSAFNIKTPAIYAGVAWGYGTSTWQYLIDKKDAEATPIAVQEGGITYGGFLGFQFSPYFAVQAQYLKFPTATVKFDPLQSWYSIMNNIDHIQTWSEAYSLAMKIMTPIMHSRFGVFASVGAALEKRHDILAKKKQNIGGIFGAGLSMYFSQYVFSELAFDYYTGNGKAESHPAYHYVPFLYAITYKLGYRIPL